MWHVHTPTVATWTRPFATSWCLQKIDKVCLRRQQDVPGRPCLPAVVKAGKSTLLHVPLHDQLVRYKTRHGVGPVVQSQDPHD